MDTARLFYLFFVHVQGHTFQVEEHYKLDHAQISDVIEDFSLPQIHEARPNVELAEEVNVDGQSVEESRENERILLVAHQDVLCMAHPACLEGVLGPLRVQAVQYVLDNEPEPEAQDDPCERENFNLEVEEEGHKLRYIVQLARDRTALNRDFSSLGHHYEV